MQQKYMITIVIMTVKLWEIHIKNRQFGIGYSSQDIQSSFQLWTKIKMNHSWEVVA